VVSGHTRDCDCGDFGVRDVTVQILGSWIHIVHVQCGQRVYTDHEALMSGEMPMTLTYTVDGDGEEAYQVLSPAGKESAE
jgi:hypothetical protein